ncbi:hypothetical protein DFJ74DRAFT_342103 [Hyaloraphidium curvatum]|nr:hypothetical protein DFJ74DRAFT_342103 [Hyaloraphidium curvatum]
MKSRFPIRGLLRIAIRTFASRAKEAGKSAIRRRTFSGIQPTGVPHLGNYLGALVHWVRMQDALTENLTPAASSNAGSKPVTDGDRLKPIYCIVDLHALTLPQDPKALHKNTMEMAASLLAVGIDPAKSIVYRQSKVAQHAELGWLLMCQTPISWLYRMHQWKTKGERDNDAQGPCLGLLAYPVLQAADIMLFKATDVPVGEDQMQHLNLARDVAQRFNHTFGHVFPVPNGLLATSSKRIMSLRDPTSKMSKSDPSDQSRINITDSPDSIRRKVQRAVTDSHPTIDYDPDGRPGVASLINLYAGLEDIEVDEAVALFRGKQARALKEAVAESCVERLRAVRERFEDFSKDETYVDRTLRDSEEAATSLATQTMAEVRRVMGLH